MSVIIGPLNHSFCGIIGQWNVVNKSFELEGRNLVPDCCRLTEKLSSNTNTYKRVSQSVVVVVVVMAAAVTAPELAHRGPAPGAGGAQGAGGTAGPCARDP